MRIATSTLLLLAFSGTPIPAQTLPPKTLAIPRGEQFGFLPRRNVGMGELDIVLDDPLGDPFANPAIRGGEPWRISFTPSIYGDKRNTAGGHSLPVSATVSGARWFGAAAVATQSLKDHPKDVFAVPSGLTGDLEERRSGRNEYFVGSLGRELGPGTSVGLKVVYGELGLVDGERRQFPSALSVSQSGQVRAVTLGAVHAFAGRKVVGATVSHSRLSTDYAVTRWRRTVSDPSDPTPGPPELWTFDDASRSSTWEGRVRYTAPIPGRDLQFGVVASVWTRDQSQAPGYELVHVPQDPGTSVLGELGAGLEMTGHQLHLAFELSVSPGVGSTQLLADSALQALDGSTIQAGDPTLDSDFRFLNWRVGVGAELPLPRGGLQAGLGIRRYGFRLEQNDRVRVDVHDANLSWHEWTPSVGGWVKIRGVEVGYTVHVVNRGSSPCDPYSYRNSCQAVSVPYHFTGLRVAPTLPDDLPDFRLTRHYLTVSVPLG